MTKSANLWAVGYDDMERANQVREEIVSLGWDKQYLILQDIAVVVRHPNVSRIIEVSGGYDWHLLRNGSDVSVIASRWRGK